MTTNPLFDLTGRTALIVSVLLGYKANEHPFPSRGPAVGLFADQEIRLLDGPLFVGEAYEIEREVVAVSGSRRTESLWVKTTVYRAGGDRRVATMLLNGASIKDSYEPYQAERRTLYGAAEAAS